MYYLDTNICIYFLNGTNDSVKKHLLSIPASEIRIPSMVRAELIYGAVKSRKSTSNLKKVRQFLSEFECIPFSDDEAEVYGRIRTTLEDAGTHIGPNDIIIAATVISNGGVLVTHNIKEFQRISELNVIDWS